MNTRILLNAASAGAVLALLLSSCSELKQNLPAPVSASTTLHEEGWGSPSSSNFHGRYLKAKQNRWDDAECKTCHGGNYLGGSSGVPCFKCHDSYPHAARFAASTGDHSAYLYAKSYPLAQCQTCHGTSYTGGTITDVSCESAGCHVDRTGAPKSPEACNTCHGDFRGLVSEFFAAAPPVSVLGGSDSTKRGVGAHQPHLKTGIVGKAVRCQECHTVPTQYTNPAHINYVVEVVFTDTLARMPSGNGTFFPSPSYDANSLKCSTTYCHGNWRLRKASSPVFNQQYYTDTVMVGGKYSPVWTGGSSEATCTTCHSSVSGGQVSAVPTGHPLRETSQCGGCHSGIVDLNGNIVDKAKHINGKVNVFGTERSF